METTADAMFPAGDYLIIDPCYVYTGARGIALLDAIWSTQGGVKTDRVTGCRFAYSPTATGDGCYTDQDGYLYGVDSGGLACLPLAMIDAATLAMLPAYDRSAEQACSGRLVMFTAPWVCVPCDAQGLIRFGPVEIATGPTWGELLAAEEEEDC